MEPPEVQRALDAAFPGRRTTQGPTGNFNPGKTNAVVNQAFKCAKVAGKVFLVISIIDEAHKVVTSDDWAKQLGSSSAGLLGAVTGGWLGGAAVGAGLGALGFNPWTVAGGALVGGLAGGALGYQWASGAYEWLYDVISN